MALIAAASAFYVYRNFGEFSRFALREWRTIAVAEVVFVVFFVGWALFRAQDPFINHTEQPMDLALLSASINSQAGHPEDPWLRGEPISYYYFGYWMMGMLSRLAAIPSNISYNLAMALAPAMAAMGMFGIVSNMARMDKARWKFAVVGGIAAALFMGVVANLEGVLEFMRLNGIGSQGFYDWIRIDGLPGPMDTQPQSWTPTDFWWWFHASRVINTFDGMYFIDNTIQEFPFFSFLLGDMHPHVMSIPFIALFLGIALNIYRLPLNFWREYRSPYPYALIMAAALALGGLGFNNFWDMPTFAALLIGVLALKAYRDGQRHPDFGRTSALSGRHCDAGARSRAILAIPAEHQRRRERHRHRAHALARRASVHRMGAIPDRSRAVPAHHILADDNSARLARASNRRIDARFRRLAAVGAGLYVQRRQLGQGGFALH